MSEYDRLIRKSVTGGLTAGEQARLEQLAGERVVAAGLISAAGLAAEQEALRTDNWLENGRRYRESREQEDRLQKARAKVQRKIRARRAMLARVNPPFVEDRFFYDQWIVEELGELPRFIADLV